MPSSPLPHLPVFQDELKPLSVLRSHLSASPWFGEPPRTSHLRVLWSQVLRTEGHVSYPIFVQVLVTCERRVSAGVMAVLEVSRGGALTECARVCVCEECGTRTNKQGM